ncbi:hypothetical protein GUJ93_ZPchr0008g11521 [Zizania palustris]|uniref:Glycosyltransferase 61 catalytic domain-containing protein n=1 Tax=Zizania palustris TaxID=103762 RepID=A0A8J5RJM6_ZIZPA|nr:hypothetical protein GUJ93_ZPchr0008g11521 [Zizania palustris]
MASSASLLRPSTLAPALSTLQSRRKPAPQLGLCGSPNRRRRVSLAASSAASSDVQKEPSSSPPEQSPDPSIVADSVKVLKEAAKTRKVPAQEVLSALAKIKKGKLDTSTFFETLGGTESPGRTWMLIFTAKGRLEKGQYFPLTAVQRFDAAGKRIENGVYLGPIGCLTFEGRLSWKKKILAFIFERVRVKIGPFGPLEIGLGGGDDGREPSTKDPFFVWFYVDEEIAVAQGRGGGVAYWCRSRADELGQGGFDYEQNPPCSSDNVLLNDLLELCSLHPNTKQKTVAPVQSADLYPDMVHPCPSSRAHLILSRYQDGEEYKHSNNQCTTLLPFCELAVDEEQTSQLHYMAAEKKFVSSFTVRVGIVLFAGCILVLITLVTMFIHHAVPLQTLILEGKIRSHNSGRLLCDFSSSRSDVCKLKGDVRIILTNASVVVVVHPSAKQQSWRMKPHPRKNDRHALARVTEVSVTSTPVAELAPECTVKHAAAAVVFSVGGYAGNMFHDFTDVLVPLYITTRRFASDVHLLVSDAQPWWLNKYRPLLRELSRRDIVDMDRRSLDGVHCYPHVIIGLDFHKEMSVDVANNIAGGGRYNMADFAHLLRRSYGLTRDTAIRLRDDDNNGAVKEKKKAPRLLIISRRATRTFTNVGAIVRTAAALGYEVVVGETELHSDLGAFARVVNSCDVLVGVHGAGLSNLVFLPARAVVVQVVPLGGLEAMAREDFGAPAIDMGLGYVQYDIAVDESTLARRYPRDHRVLRDPAAVRRDGWLALRSAYLVGQNVTLDVARFRAALSRALQLLRH